MSYEVRLVRSVEREMDRLPAAYHTRISRRILSLEDDLRPGGVKNFVVVKNSAFVLATTGSYIPSMTTAVPSRFLP